MFVSVRNAIATNVMGYQERKTGFHSQTALRTNFSSNIDCRYRQNRINLEDLWGKLPFMNYGKLIKYYILTSLYLI